METRAGRVGREHVLTHCGVGCQGLVRQHHLEDRREDRIGVESSPVGPGQGVA